MWSPATSGAFASREQKNNDDKIDLYFPRVFLFIRLIYFSHTFTLYDYIGKWKGGALFCDSDINWNYKIDIMYYMILLKP